jgi:uncharacterized membrane protein
MLGQLGNLSVVFGRPWWLIGIPLILPPLVWFSMKSLAGLGGFRRAMAILFRAVVLTLIVLALSEPQAVRKNDKLTTMFLLDVSESLPHEWQRPMQDFVSAATKAQMRAGDMAGVIVFGKNARVESPPTPHPSTLVGIENQPERDFTDIGGAIKLTMASFPEDTAKRLVIISDGNENRGNAVEQAIAARELGAEIDVLPIEYRYDREVLVEKISMPADVKLGETVNINVVLRASEPTTGSLQIFQKTENGRESATGDAQPTPVTLQRGVNVLSLKKTITTANFYTFQAEFIPDANSGDKRAVNNRAEGFTHARGEATVLLIEGSAGEHDELVQALQRRKFKVTVLAAPKVESSGIIGGDPLPTDMAQLQPFDCVILGNVPKDSIPEELQTMIERNVHDFGAGLVMIGGPNSFGAGGWMNTPIEKALPVDMQIRSMKVMGKSALVMVMHASEIPEGNYWQKQVAKQAIDTLSSYDYAGMLHWEGQEAWLFTLRQIGSSKQSMMRAIDRMTPGDMPDFDPSLQMGMSALRKRTDAMTKHFIVISDGDPTPPTSAVVNQLAANKITVTTVLVAAHGGDTMGVSAMQNLSQKTKGRFYNVTNPKALPRIYQKEARLISRPLIYERPQPWSPNLVTFSEPVVGVPSSLPGITGVVQTSLKENELVEVPIVSPLPSGTGQINPLLAHWTYGLGRAVAFTSDAGRKWTSAWRNWDNYAAFWSQVIRWALRPVDKGNMTMSVRREEGRIKVVVDALDKDNQFQNFLQFRAVAVRPDLKPVVFDVSQVAPGRYEGVLEDAEARGNYFINLGYRTPEGSSGVLSSGVSVPYSDEYRELKSNPATLETIADLAHGKVLEWKYRRDGRGVDLQRTLDTGDVFRRDKYLQPPRSFTDLWPTLLWLAACLFLGDVAVRRVAPDVDRIKKLVADGWEKLRGREVAPATDYMEKLKSRKAEVDDQLDRSRAATRFEAPPLPAGTVPVDEPLLTGASDPNRPRPAPRPQPQPGLAPDQKSPAQESYTNRLLRAKQKVWEEREKEKEKGKGGA